MRIVAASGVALVVAAGLALADSEVANPWAEAKQPATGAARAVGGYSAGCVQGAAELALDGTGYHVANPGRARNFGHPDLVDFVADLGKSVDRGGHGVLMIGDLGQPRGGPAPSGHSSHQSGLDADIWYWHPKSAEKKTLTRKQRARISARRIVSAKTKTRNKNWSDKIEAVLKLAASDDRVARIFVNPVIKKELCTSIGEDDRAWLQKLRPWWGHDAHFHVRLHCPARSKDCEAQDAITEGDGCAEIDWWLDDEAQAERKKRQGKYQKKVGARPELPERCAEIIAADP